MHIKSKTIVKKSLQVKHELYIFVYAIVLYIDTECTDLQSSFPPPALAGECYEITHCVDENGNELNLPTPQPTTSTTNQAHLTLQDIGCNYANLGGIAIPTSTCMPISSSDSFSYWIEWNCNDNFDGINLDLWTDGAGCNGNPFTSQDYTQC